MALSATPPDLTAGETIPSNLGTTINLGATGMRGWVFYDNETEGLYQTLSSRQIQVRNVDAGSPAAGFFLPDDLILGASGTAAAPGLFTMDARRALAAAIADAEAASPALLKLIRWRSGTQSVVTLTLRTMGAYTNTAPFNCAKSEKILREGMDHLYTNESSGRYRFGVISLLAAQDDFFPDRALYLQKAQTEAHAMVKSASFLQDLRDYTAPTNYPTPWERSYELIVLGEYYLLTGDNTVLPTIEALAINLAKGSSHYGTIGNALRNGPFDASDSYRPTNTGYGPVNSVGMPALLGVQLAKRCGVNDPVIDEMIARGKMFFASYAGKGSVGYGEHEPYDLRHENNGKSGLAALILGDDPAYSDESEFFIRMALASGDQERDNGHTGAFFNYVWGPLGVARGGPAAVQEFFSQISWQLDLHRRWDGGFDYDSYSENRAPNGNEYYNFRMSTAMLLTYALPLETLFVTGRDSSGGSLSSQKIAECRDAEAYDAAGRTISQLVTDLGSWSPRVRLKSSGELASRSLDAATVTTIRNLALDQNGSSRYGAIQTLGGIRDTDFTGQLVTLLNDNDGMVRTLAAKALHLFAKSFKELYRGAMLTTLVSRYQPAFPVVVDDPLQFDQMALIRAIFGSGTLANNRAELDVLISDLGSELVYDALKVASRHPSGRARGSVSNLYKVLTNAEVDILAPELVDMVAKESPGDRMFSLGVRAEALKAMGVRGAAEGIPAVMGAIDASNGWGGFHNNMLSALAGYGGSATLVTPDPDVVSFAQRYLTGGTLAAAQAVLDAIAADPNPANLFYFKSIQSVTADSNVVSAGVGSTVLRVVADDLADGDSIFTWNQVSGPGSVAFLPNGTNSAANTTVQFSGGAGTYEFQVTMSDSRGLTEVKDTVSVELEGEGGTTRPMRVFILAGQSNMEGHGEISPAGTPGTLETLVNSDPATFGHLKDGAAWAVRDDVWVHYHRNNDANPSVGGLTTTYGASLNTIGPELQFGHEVGDAYGDQVLIIKTAWGGKSLAVDFRPPSSTWSGGTPTAPGDEGFYYQEMMTTVSDVLANLSTHFPEYDSSAGYQVSGFFWHQGWNDRVNQAHNDQYEANMENFINDVRSDLGVPALPFVIATTGMSGWSDTHPRALSLMNAQLAMEDPVKYPAFEGNVAVVDTRDFWRDAANSPANQSYHWNRNAETYFLIGQASAAEMKTMVPPEGNPTGPELGEVTILDFVEGVGAGGSGLKTLQTGYDASAADKLVVVLGAEHGWPGNIGGEFRSVTYGGVALTEAVQEGAGIPTAAIFYLDEPGAAGDLVVDQGNHNGTLYAVYQLAGTAPGVGAVNQSTSSGVSLATSAANSMVVTGILDAGPNGGNGSPNLAVALPLNEDTLTDLYVGSRWTSLSTGSSTEAALGVATNYSFSGSGATDLLATVVVEFLAAEPDGPVLADSFDYPTGNMAGNDGGTGFGGAWSATRNDPTVATPGKTWGGLPVEGGYARGSAWSGLIRPVGSSLSSAGFMTNGSTLWFSVIVGLEGQNASNADISISLGTDGFVSSNFGERENLAAGEGIGVSHSGGLIQGVYWQNSDADAIAERVENDSSTSISPSIPGNPTSAFIVGKIEWGSDSGAAEKLTLYAPGTDLELGAPVMASWTIPALNQSLFDSLAIQLKDTSQVDEIRFGGSYQEVTAAISESSPPTLVTVPSLSGLTQSAAEASVVGSGLSVGSVSQAFSNTIPTNNVISQTPGGGSSVLPGASVDLVISLGVEPTTVPNLIGLSQGVATTSLGNASLILGAVTTEYSGTVPSGNVISQSLSAGASVPPGSAVSLSVSLGIDPSPKLVNLTVSSVSTSGWTSVDLGQIYNSPVIIATEILPSASTPPVKARLRNVTASGFEVRLDRLDGSSDPVTIDLSIVAVDEGVYTQAVDGITMEAVRFISTTTSRKGAWTAESRAYQNSYQNPVVIGQVMSANDSGWSAFWCQGGSRTSPPSGTALGVGKHVGEDPNTTRADEMIGYIVIEAGSGTINGSAYEAGVGNDSVLGIGNSSNPYTYSLSGGLSSASSVALSLAAMDGGDGGMAVLVGSNPFTSSTLNLMVNEDQLGDTERAHTSEQVSYLVIE